MEQFEKKFKQLFKDLLGNDKISKDEYDKICPKGSRPVLDQSIPRALKMADVQKQPQQ